MIEILLATTLTCSEGQELIDNIQVGQMEFREEIIDTIKTNTEPGCYEESDSVSP
mgnify:FL=1|tara:strand:- start:198 stop:362 length:165 start_codon:yes stop_codon:yes gene_type:complete